MPLKSPYRPVLLLLSLALLASCKTSPPIVVATQCPQLPELPASLNQPPKSLHALDELEAALRELAQDAKPTPGLYSNSSDGSPTSELF